MGRPYTGNLEVGCIFVLRFDDNYLVLFCNICKRNRLIYKLAVNIYLKYNRIF